MIHLTQNWKMIPDTFKHTPKHKHTHTHIYIATNI